MSQAPATDAIERAGLTGSSADSIAELELLQQISAGVQSLNSNAAHAVTEDAALQQADSTFNGTLGDMLAELTAAVDALNSTTGSAVESLTAAMQQYNASAAPGTRRRGYDSAADSAAVGPLTGPAAEAEAALHAMQNMLNGTTVGIAGLIESVSGLLSPFAAAKDALGKWQQLVAFPLGPILGASSALQDVVGVVGSSPAAAPQALSIGAPAPVTDKATISAPSEIPAASSSLGGDPFTAQDILRLLTNGAMVPASQGAALAPSDAEAMAAPSAQIGPLQPVAGAAAQAGSALQSAGESLGNRTAAVGDALSIVVPAAANQTLQPLAGAAAQAGSALQSAGESLGNRTAAAGDALSIVVTAAANQTLTAAQLGLDAARGAAQGTAQALGNVTVTVPLVIGGAASSAAQALGNATITGPLILSNATAAAALAAGNALSGAALGLGTAASTAAQDVQAGAQQLRQTATGAASQAGSFVEGIPGNVTTRTDAAGDAISIVANGTVVAAQSGADAAGSNLRNATADALGGVRGAALGLNATLARFVQSVPRLLLPDPVGGIAAAVNRTQQLAAAVADIQRVFINAAVGGSESAVPDIKSAPDKPSGLDWASLDEGLLQALSAPGSVATGQAPDLAPAAASDDRQLTPQPSSPTLPGLPQPMLLIPPRIGAGSPASGRRLLQSADSDRTAAEQDSDADRHGRSPSGADRQAEQHSRAPSHAPHHAPSHVPESHRHGAQTPAPSPHHAERRPVAPRLAPALAPSAPGTPELDSTAQNCNLIETAGSPSLGYFATFEVKCIEPEPAHAIYVDMLIAVVGCAAAGLRGSGCVQACWRTCVQR